MKALVNVAPSAVAVSRAKAPAGTKAKHDPVSSLALVSSVRDCSRCGWSRSPPHNPDCVTAHTSRS